MAKTIIVNVTAEDIRLGERTDCDNCPIVRALRSCGYSYASVGPIHAFLNDTEESMCKLPSVAQEFIRAFDLGLSPQPFTFSLEVV